MSLKAVFFWVIIFGIAMAFLESAVVVYIRELIYPEGFAFPLATMKSEIAVTEILREAATIIMLISAGVLAGRSFTERFAWFILAFAIWDIFYYIFLWLLIGWPENLFIWDVLFLIPVTWTAPVIAPLIISSMMIMLSLIILIYSYKGISLKIEKREWLLLVSGSATVIVSFAWDYSLFVFDHLPSGSLWNLPGSGDMFDLATTYLPTSFNWLLFSAGVIIILGAICSLWVRMRRITLTGTLFTTEEHLQL